MIANPKDNAYSILIPNKDNTGVNHLGTLVKASEKRVNNVINRNLNRQDGLAFPSSASQKGSASAPRFSGLQPVLKPNYKLSDKDVKKIKVIMAIINALQ